MGNDFEGMFLRGLDRLAQRCNFTLSEWEIEAYTCAFRDIGFETGVEALKFAFFKIRGTQMPSPMDLLEYIGITQPEAPKARDDANEISSKIISCISRFGGYNANAAKAYLGEDAWEVVVGFGGWDTLCMTEIDDLPTIRAQLRDLAESKARIGFHRHAELGIGKHTHLIEGIINDLTK